MGSINETEKNRS